LARSSNSHQFPKETSKTQRTFLSIKTETQFSFLFKTNESLSFFFSSSHWKENK
jgi:hypothetical protein